MAKRKITTYKPVQITDTSVIDAENALKKLDEILDGHYVPLALAGVGCEVSHARRTLNKWIADRKGKELW